MLLPNGNGSPRYGEIIFCTFALTAAPLYESRDWFNPHPRPLPMKALVASALSLLLLATPAWAGEGARVRLVPGGNVNGLTLPGADSKAPVYVNGGFSVGAMSVPLGSIGLGQDSDHSVGGYASYSADWLRLTSTLRNNGGAAIADLSASRTLDSLGLSSSTAALTLGRQWTAPAGYSFTPGQPASLSGGDDSHLADWSLSLSFTHDVTPFLSLGGFAAATHGEDGDSGANGSDLRLGAGLGLKF